MIPAETEVKSRSSSVIARTDFRVLLATRRRHDCPKRTGNRSSRRRFLQTNKSPSASRFFGSRLLTHDSPRFRRPPHFLLPDGHPELASLLQTVSLDQLLFPETTSNHRVAVLVDAMDEVLAEVALDRDNVGLPAFSRFLHSSGDHVFKEHGSDSFLACHW